MGLDLQDERFSGDDQTVPISLSDSSDDGPRGEEPSDSLEIKEDGSFLSSPMNAPLSFDAAPSIPAPIRGKRKQNSSAPLPEEFERTVQSPTDTSMETSLEQGALFDTGEPLLRSDSSPDSYGSLSDDGDYSDENSLDVMGLVVDESRELSVFQTGELGESGMDSLDRMPEHMAAEAPSEDMDLMLDAGVSATVREGILSLRRGLRGEAIGHFEQALRSDPDDTMAQAYLKLAHELLVRDSLPGAKLDSIPRLRIGREMLMTLDLDPVAGGILAMLDGAMTLEELEAMLPHMDRETIYSHLSTAHDNGLIEFET